MNKPKQKYWYTQTYYFCPVCGHDSTLKERQYSDKPKDPTEIYEEIQKYDYCLE